VRDDSGVYSGYTVPNFYDPMISKLSVWAPSRAEAIARMSRALGEYLIKGITTNVRYLQAIMRHPEFQEGDYDTGFLARHHDELVGTDDPHLREVATLASVVYVHQRNLEQAKALPKAGNGSSAAISPWRLAGRRRSLRR
jgi:acetyl-CoA carboxylase biotin carboxylase subunit